MNLQPLRNRLDRMPMLKALVPFAAGIVLAVLLEQAVCRVPGLMRPSGKNCT